MRDTSATHTRVLEKIQADTQQMRNHLKVLDLQNEIERLDRDWEAWRQENLSRSVSGEYFEPNRFNSSILPLLILIFGCLLAITLQGLLAVLLVMVVTLCLSGFLLRLLLDTSRRYAAAMPPPGGATKTFASNCSSA